MAPRGFHAKRRLKPARDDPGYPAGLHGRATFLV